MDPFSMMLMMGAGTVLQGIGGLMGMSASKDYNKSQQEEIKLQDQVEGQRKLAMELDAKRKSLENLRKVQQAQAMGLTTASSQGAIFGTGFQGGQQQAQSQGNWNQAGINQNLQSGENIFGLNSQISQQKILQANAQQGMQTSSAISSFGGSLVSSANAFGRVASGFGGNPKTTTSGTGGNIYGPYQGTMW